MDSEESEERGMLRLQDTVVSGTLGDEIEKEVSRRLVELMEWLKSQMESVSDFEKFEMFTKLFPVFVPKKHMKKIFDHVYRSLKTEEYAELGLLEQYVLAKVIDIKVEACKKAGESTIQRLPNREAILKEMITQDIAESKQDADEILEIVEDLYCYVDICFEDMDYLFLDYLQSPTR